MNTFKTLYDEIVNVEFIGDTINPIDMNNLLKKASNEDLYKAGGNEQKVLVLGIDFQNDFVNGSLTVPGAKQDIENFTRFIYNNMNKISEIDVSIDTHIPLQIFHPIWWTDENGSNPEPFTAITLKDLDEGRWKGYDEVKSRDYIQNLEKLNKKVLCIWPYHCIQGTLGCALENQFSNMLYFFNVAKKSAGQRIIKGLDPLSEMYGIIKPEYDTKKYINNEYLNRLGDFNKIVIAGEAKSHCVMESIRQILEHFEERHDITSRVYILEDCMSNIPGFEKIADETFNWFKKKYGINIVNSSTFML